MAAWLATQGHLVNRKRAQRLMRLLGLAAIYQRPNTSKPAAAHKIYPYLLRGLAIERVNQVWCSDVTYIPMAKGFLYLVVIMDWVSRAVLAWRLSIWARQHAWRAERSTSKSSSEVGSHQCVLKLHQHRLPRRQPFHLGQQRPKRLLLLLRGEGERCIAIAGGDREQRREQRSGPARIIGRLR
jgi:HTH-like domain